MIRKKDSKPDLEGSEALVLCAHIELPKEQVTFPNAASHLFGGLEQADTTLVVEIRPCPALNYSSRSKTAGFRLCLNLSHSGL